MKEILDIIDAYTVALATGKRMALATVVHVEGSSYRRPGARMLVTDDGQLTGAISGGCLEGDALRKALLAINQQQNKLVTYDTTEDDDAKFGVQLGCNGIVHILFEPIDPDQEIHPISLLQKLSAKRQEGVLITLFSLSNPHQAVPGTCLLLLPEIGLLGQAGVEYENKKLLLAANHALHNKQSSIKEYDVEGISLSAFVEFIAPPIALVIVGAGNDAFPMAAMARVLGWHTTVADGRATHATLQRFPQVNRLLITKPEQMLAQLQIDAQTVFVLMTHNYNYDLALLKLLVNEKQLVYIGSLGPKKKLERMINDLKTEGITLTGQQQEKIFGPVGLDIGAETAEEIALSVIAEIKKVLSDKAGYSLREKQVPIHQQELRNASVEL